MLVGLLTAFAMIAFAANSLLARVALGDDLIDPIAYTALRLAGGAAVLVPLSRLAAEPSPKGAGRHYWVSGSALFVYAIAFSSAYLYLDAGMGALILFASVQATMIGFGLWSGERPRPLQWIGLLVALGGLAYLVSPGMAAPDPRGASLMAISGVSWGLYSLRGRNGEAPLSSTSANFVRSLPLAAIAAAAGIGSLRAAPAGVVLALVSGSVTSGLGYVLWYRALKELTTTAAAVVQLLVPVLAAFGGVMFLAERVSFRLLIAGVMVLGGVTAALMRPVSDPVRRARGGSPTV
jgi:drug/metabolite transporter (DMT)-like permease